MDVVLIRLLLIGLLIVYHAFAIHTHAWRPPYDAFIPIVAYDWFGMFSHSFRLEAMVFISGLLFGYNFRRKPEMFTFQTCVIKKAKRILLPCFIFGIIYYLMFYDLSVSPLQIIYRILNGCGHLWFLPMIFWCFVLTYAINKILPLLICIKILPFLFLWNLINIASLLPFGLGYLGSFFLYFYIGFCIKCNWITLPPANNRNLLAALMLFIVFFLAFMFMRNNWIGELAFMEKVLRHLINNVFRVILSLSAIFILYGLANKIKVIEYLEHRPFLITLSGYCYGVYIYQQFILQVLYYKTSLPLLVNEYWLPWLATGITLVASLLLCHITLKFRLGRFLIG